ncbi:uncharacterized protein SCHCODRAFT_02284942 [Schizophyllum commune H4-8]|uniref:uncharacterized protein n=1 Tax=Schizophyllum commune (strain H4-8 / FGSC 9210) TaxID=578458 RepID=UPI00215FA731|nr:uncharacterized protein SCHCODRAFT_02284942 [Schizophyllum commune H4-8]KAI5892155.1 hypothetical protein SCHCODRAFT_02284942 [Schizophyllum commune H4-8]
MFGGNEYLPCWEEPLVLLRSAGREYGLRRRSAAVPSWRYRRRGKVFWQGSSRRTDFRALRSKGSPTARARTSIERKTSKPPVRGRVQAAQQFIQSAAM